MKRGELAGALLVAALVCAALAACNSSPSSSAPAGPASGGTAPPAPAQAHAVASASAAAIPAALVRPPPPRTLHVPRAPHPITPSTRFTVSEWGTSVNTHTLLDETGRGAVPVSEARFLWGDGKLYVLFYAGDLDLEVHNTKHDGPVWADDSVTLAFLGPDGKSRMLVASPTGIVADGVCPLDAASLGDARCDLSWESHARLAVDYDGTLNKLGDNDEEWNIQFAIPLKSIATASAPGTRLSFTVERCELAHNGSRSCGFWGNTQEPAELILD